MAIFENDQHYLVCVIIYFCVVARTHSLQCLGKSGKYECCNGYMWNETLQNCDTRCLPGYFGNNCTSQCSLGRYGEGCSNLCTKCEKAQCNVSFGCPVSTTELPELSLTQVQKVVQNIENVSMKMVPDSNTKISREETQDNLWQILSVAFSIATFVIVMLYIAKRSCKKEVVVMAPKDKSNVTWPLNNIVEGPNMEDQSYQPLHNKAVFNGTANVTINMDTVEKNFTVILKTEQNNGMPTRHDTTQPKRNMGNSINENGKLYESYVNRELV